MHYKTIVLGLLDQYPVLYEELRVRRSILQALDRYSTDLKASHDFWTDQLARARPGSEPTQTASEALELAIQELRNRLSTESQKDPSAEPLSLDEATAYIREAALRYIRHHSRLG
jgi:hypothetical protein